MEMSAINRTEAIITRILRFDIVEIIRRTIFGGLAIQYLARSTGFFKENAIPYGTPQSQLEIKSAILDR